MLIVAAELHVGLQVAVENEHETPAGNEPMHEKVTDCVVPDDKAAVAVVVAGLPCTTVPDEGFSNSEKSNGGGVDVTVKVNDVAFVIEPEIPVTVIV